MIRQAVGPLRLIFWGGLTCIIDLSITQTSNGHGFRFDFVNDAVGVLMILIGLFRLGQFPVHPTYAQTMSFVKAVGVLSFFEAIAAHFVMPVPAPVRFMSQLFGIASLIAILLFCMAMRWLSSAADLKSSQASWQVTLVLFAIIYAVPLGLLHLLGLGAALTGRTFHVNLGPAGLLLLPLFAAPLIHLFVSTSRMQREAEL